MDLHFPLRWGKDRSRIRIDPALITAGKPAQSPGAEREERQGLWGWGGVGGFTGGAAPPWPLPAAQLSWTCQST